MSLEGVGFDAYLRQKTRVISQKDPSSVFIYAHSPAPGHRPFSTQSPDDVDKYTSIHLNHIEIANIEMQQDVNLLMKHNPNAISIIAGDHGPFLTKTGVGLLSNPDKYCANDIDRYDMQDRYGAFLAIRWPDKDYATKHDIEILQDIFPAVLAYLFDDDRLFDETRIKSRTTVSPQNICGVSIEDGIIVGGKDDGRPLFKGIQ